MLALSLPWLKEEGCVENHQASSSHPLSPVQLASSTDRLTRHRISIEGIDPFEGCFGYVRDVAFDRSFFIATQGLESYDIGMSRIGYRRRSAVHSRLRSRLFSYRVDETGRSMAAVAACVLTGELCLMP